MRACYIFCAGVCQAFDGVKEENALLIAADGGVRHLEKFGLTADLTLGDFDSLGYVPQNAQVFPVEKDDTDAMLAVRRGLAEGCDRFYLYGALEGERVDHTMANFQALHYLSQRGARGYLIGKDQIVTAITDDAVAFDRACTGYLSVFSMGKDARGVTIRGAQYELENAELTSGYPLGVSNQFTGRPATVAVSSGTLLLIWDRDNGIPSGKEVRL